MAHVLSLVLVAHAPPKLLVNQLACARVQFLRFDRYSDDPHSSLDRLSMAKAGLEEGCFSPFFYSGGDIFCGRPFGDPAVHPFGCLEDEFTTEVSL